ncbi:MAG: dimethylargininase [Thermoanaerobaculia bacterium]|nr:dimethylargininase [Thermoanaerobaculia bacterium]
MPIAVVREVSPSIAQCELTHVDRQPIDFDRATAQHDEYVRALESLGYRAIRLPALVGHPDAVFVEDCAVVVDEVAVITRPGAASRMGEVASIADALRPHRNLAFIEAPATLDGGDVLRAGRLVRIGRTARTNDEGIAQLRTILEPFGYDVGPAELTGCLHLKTAVTSVAPGILLVNRAWVDPSQFPGFDFVDVDPSEPFAANALLVGDALVLSSAFPRTRARLEARGIHVTTVDATELAKAEGGVTCCSLLFD